MMGWTRNQQITLVVVVVFLITVPVLWQINSVRAAQATTEPAETMETVSTQQAPDDYDGDGIPDDDEEPGQHWQIEAEPPEIEKFKIDKYLTGENGNDPHIVINLNLTDRIGVQKVMLHGSGLFENIFDKGSTDVGWSLD